MKSWDRVLASNWTGLTLVGILAFAGFGLIQPWFRGTPASPASTKEKPLPPARIDEMEPAVRAHVKSVQDKCHQILGDEQATMVQRGRAFGELGKIYLLYDLAEPAAASLHNATQLDSDEFRWPYFWARALAKTAALDEAGNAMTLALQRMARDSTARAANQLAALCFLGETAQSLDRPDQARKYFDDALALQPQCVFALLGRGNVLAAKGEYPKAIADFRAALERIPQAVAIRQALAAAYRNQGDTARALATAPRTDSQRRQRPVLYPDPLLNDLMTQSRSGARCNAMAAELIDAGRYRAALGQIERGLAFHPTMLTLRINRTRCLLELEQYEASLAVISELRKELPEDDGARTLWIAARSRLPSEQQTALADARRWQAEAPKDAKVHVLVGKCHLALNQNHEAVACFVEAARLAPAEVALHLECLVPLGRLERYADAKATYEKLLVDFPNDAEVESSFARFLATCPDQHQRDGKRSLALIRTLLNEYPTAARQATLACALAEVGDFPGAKTAIQKAIGVIGNDGSPGVRRRLAAIAKVIAQKQPYRERWPFADPAWKSAPTPGQK